MKGLILALVLTMQMGVAWAGGDFLDQDENVADYSRSVNLNVYSDFCASGFPTNTGDAHECGYGDYYTERLADCAYWKAVSKCESDLGSHMNQGCRHRIGLPRYYPEYETVQSSKGTIMVPTCTVKVSVSGISAD